MPRDVSAYLNTKVSFYRTQEVITRLLEKHNIEETRFTNLRDQIVLEFNYPQQHEQKSFKVGVRFIMPLPKETNPKKRDQLRNQRYRALFYILKTKLEAVEFGLREFGQEFLGDLVYTLPNGTTGTVAELIGPKIEQSMVEGKSQVLLEDFR